MDEAHEFLKLLKDRMAAGFAIEALKNDKERSQKVYVAEKTHRRIVEKLHFVA